MNQKNIILTNQEVHLWWTELDLPKTEIQSQLEILSKDEQERANRFRFEKDRNRYIVCRVKLRKLLANYLKIEPEIIKFEYSDRGKPSLARSCNPENLEFNISHCQDLGLYGFIKDNLIGVDLEYIRNLSDGEKLAKRFFTSQEYQTITSLLGAEKERAFFKAWTAKEAFLKATGAGLSNSLDRIEFDLRSDHDLKLLMIDGDSQMINDWRLFSFAPVENAIATAMVNSSQKYQFKTFYLDSGCC